jgi:hypothetical protein
MNIAVARRDTPQPRICEGPARRRGDKGKDVGCAAFEIASRLRLRRNENYVPENQTENHYRRYA